MPHFSNWGKSALGKLTYFFKKIPFIRNKEAFKEGDKCDYIYIVSSGEFEVTKRMLGDNNRNLNFMSFLGPTSDQTKLSDKSNNVFNKQDNLFAHKVKVLGSGNMIGEEDAVAFRNYTTSLKCVSNHGELLAIKTQDFYSIVRPNEETWKYIKANSKEKEIRVINSLKKSKII